jgi:hypothetical protein
MNRKDSRGFATTPRGVQGQTLVAVLSEGMSLCPCLGEGYQNLIFN